MGIKQLIKTFLFHYFLIYGLTVIASFFWCLADGTERIPLDYFWKIMLFSLVADAPLFVFYSRREISSKQYAVRVVIHAILLEILLPAAGYLIGMWHGVGGYFIFFAVVLAVDGSIFGITYLKTSLEAEDINVALKKRDEKKLKEGKSDEFGEDNSDKQPE